MDTLILIDLKTLELSADFFNANLILNVNRLCGSIKNNLEDYLKYCIHFSFDRKLI